MKNEYFVKKIKGKLRTPRPNHLNIIINDNNLGKNRNWPLRKKRLSLRSPEFTETWKEFWTFPNYLPEIMGRNT